MCVIIIHVFMHYALCKDINFIESPPSVELIGISELGPKKKKKSDYRHHYNNQKALTNICYHV